VISECWKRFRDVYPAPGNREAADAAEILWQLSLGKKSGYGGADRLEGWRSRFEKARLRTQTGTALTFARFCADLMGATRPVMAYGKEDPAKVYPAEKFTLISQHPLFCGLPPTSKKRLFSYVKQKRYGSGDLIFNKGDPGIFLCIVYVGIVQIYVQSYDGKDAVFNLIKEGECFGEIALLDGKPRSATARAFTNSELLMIDRRDFIPILEDNPASMIHLIQLLCAKLRHTSEQVENVMFFDLRGRLARTLLELSAVSKSPSRIIISQREIAQIAGFSREMINRQLQTWVANSWIRLGRKEIIILEPAALSELSDCF
jgi:CRP-like cAMP-binding protein